jgi:RES domain-containing protein
VPELPGFRISSWDTPLRANPNRSDGRWNYAGSEATQYISLHPLGAWAEFLRWHGLTDPADYREIRQAVWAIRVIADDILVVRFDNADVIGLEAEDLISDDWTACQAAADRLRLDAGAPKVLQVPNAALPGTQNIVILEERVSIPYTFEPIDPIDLPSTLIGSGASPPPSLRSLVRFRDEPHLEYLEWTKGNRFRLAEPKDD